MCHHAPSLCVISRTYWHSLAGVTQQYFMTFRTSGLYLVNNWMLWAAMWCHVLNDRCQQFPVLLKKGVDWKCRTGQKWTKWQRQKMQDLVLHFHTCHLVSLCQVPYCEVRHFQRHRKRNKCMLWRVALVYFPFKLCGIVTVSWLWTMVIDAVPCSKFVKITHHII